MPWRAAKDAEDTVRGVREAAWEAHEFAEPNRATRRGTPTLWPMLPRKNSTHRILRDLRKGAGKDNKHLVQKVLGGKQEAARGFGRNQVVAHSNYPLAFDNHVADTHPASRHTGEPPLNPARGPANDPRVSDGDFVKRAYVAPEEKPCFRHHKSKCLKCFPDENALVYLWAKSYAHTPYGVARYAHRDATPEELEYWDEVRECIKWHATHAVIELACSPKDPDAIHAFACTSGDTVHYVVVKRNAKREGFMDELLKFLLGNRLEKSCGYTSDLVEMRRAGGIPRTWYRDDYWYLRKHLPRVAA